MKNKIYLLIISIFTLFIGVNTVDAASLEWKSGVTKKGNTAELGVYLYVEEGETITKATFACATDNAEVKCEVKKNDKYSGPDFVFENGTAITKSDTGFSRGENHLVNLVLTNESAKTAEVKVSLTGSSYSMKNPDRSSLTVTVDKKSSSNAKASSVRFSQGTMVPAFNPDVYDYTVYNIQDTINSVIGTHECQDANTCDFSWSGGKSISNLNKIFLNMGENKVTLELTSEDGQNKQTYNFTIIRGETKFNSTKLASLKIGDYILTPSFSKDVLEYSVNIPNKISSLENVIEYATEDPNANVSTDKFDNLVIGENIIKITVDNANSDGTTTYTIKVNRMSLESIEVTNYKDDIVTYVDGEGVKYELSEEEFKMQYPDDYIKIIDGTYKFNKDGERVTEENNKDDKEDKKEKSQKKKDNKIFLIIGLVIVGLIIIVVSGILIFKKKPEGKDKKTKKKSKKNKESDSSEDEENLESNEDNQDIDEEIDETGIEEETIRLKKMKSNNEDDTVDIDEALSDLMSTKQYNLEDLTKKEEE